MDYKQALVAVQKAEPERTVTACCDYDSDYYIVTAVKNTNGVDKNDPFFAVSKRTKEIIPFSPASNIDKFDEAMRKRLVYLRK